MKWDNKNVKANSLKGIEKWFGVRSDLLKAHADKKFPGKWEDDLREVQHDEGTQHVGACKLVLQVRKKKSKSTTKKEWNYVAQNKSEMKGNHTEQVVTVWLLKDLKAYAKETMGVSSKDIANTSLQKIQKEPRAEGKKWKKAITDAKWEVLIATIYWVLQKKPCKAGCEDCVAGWKEFLKEISKRFYERRIVGNEPKRKKRWFTNKFKRKSN